MVYMETDTIQMSEQLASIDGRLTVVEYEVAGLKQQVDTLTEAVAVLTTEVTVLSRTAATKEDIARIGATLAALQANCATKADLALLETRIMKWMIITLVGVAALNSTFVLVVVKLLQV
jgi:hypothetical protein